MSKKELKRLAPYLEKIRKLGDMGVFASSRDSSEVLASFKPTGDGWHPRILKLVRSGQAEMQP